MSEEGESLSGVEGAEGLIKRGIDTREKLAEAYHKLEGELEHRPKPPGRDSSQEDWRKFRERIGMIDPEKPGYQLPEDLPESERDRVAEATRLIPEGSYTDAEYRDWAHKLASRNVSEREEARTQIREAISKEAEQSREVHGVDAMVSAEEETQKRFGSDPALLAKITPLMKHPLWVETLSTLAEAQKERALPQHEANIKAPATKLTIQQMGHELEQLQNITNHPDFKAADPANGEVIAKADRLFHIMHDNGYKSALEMQKHRG